MEEEIISASASRKKSTHVKVSYCEERKEWQWERACVIWSSVMSLLVGCTQNMLERRRIPSDPSGILMLLFRPRGDFRDRRWAWKGIIAKLFHWFPKSLLQIIWEADINLNRLPLPSPSSLRVHDFLQKWERMRTSSRLSPPPKDRTWHLC